MILALPWEDVVRLVAEASEMPTEVVQSALTRHGGLLVTRERLQELATSDPELRRVLEAAQDVLTRLKGDRT